MLKSDTTRNSFVCCIGWSKQHKLGYDTYVLPYLPNPTLPYYLRGVWLVWVSFGGIVFSGRVGSHTTLPYPDAGFERFGGYSFSNPTKNTPKSRITLPLPYPFGGLPYYFGVCVSRPYPTYRTLPPTLLPRGVQGRPLAGIGI